MLAIGLAERAGALAIDAANALAWGAAGGFSGLPGWQAAADASAAAAAPDATQQALTAGAAVVVDALAATLGFTAALMRMAATEAMYVLLPLAGALYMVPALQRTAVAPWLSYGLAVFVVVPCAVVLRLGTVLLASAVGAGGSGGAAALVLSTLVALGVTTVFVGLVTRASLFGGGHLAAAGGQAVRVVRSAGAVPPGLRERLAEKRERLVTRYGPVRGGRQGAAPVTPGMFTHSHTHGHLVGRDRGAVAVGGGQPQPQQSHP
jgi:hypothetical protein